MRKAIAVVVGLVVVTYALVIAKALLPGVLVGSLVVVAERLQAKGAVEGGVDVFDTVLAVVGAVLLAGYALLITQQFLIGVGAIGAFLAAVWLSGSADRERDTSGERASGFAGN